MTKQWKERPDDMFFSSLQELKEHVTTSRAHTYERNGLLERLRVRAEDDEILVYDDRKPEGGALLSHYAFVQLCARAKAPAGFLRTLPTELACQVLNHTLEGAEPGEGKLLLSREARQELMRVRAITGPGYGRIWDDEVVAGVLAACGDDWVMPDNDKPMSGISDRDMFIFLVNQKQAVKIPSGVKGEKDRALQPGVLIQNSEVGKNVFGVATFIYDLTTDTRLMIERKKDKPLRIRHNRRAPTRFMQEALPELERHMESDISSELEAVKRAVTIEMGDVAQVKQWLQRHGFQAQILESVGIKLRELPAKTELSLWTVEQVLVSIARELPFMDERLELERKAGKLLLSA